MGDRIAIMREGQLIQYATSDEILAAPANEFVASFVGADRGLKRLRVWRLGDLGLDPPPRDLDGSEPSIGVQTTLRDALSFMLTEGVTQLVVLDDAGAPVGAVTLEAIAALLGQERKRTPA
jgi:osmoprotectant transport system ATP-binding protein